MAADGDLYHTDFFAWTQAQGRAIRAAATGANLPIDWRNVAEEIETLGRAERREVSSRLGTIIEHLLKLMVSPAAPPRRGWIGTVRRTRSELEDVLRESPSLRPEVPAMVREIGRKVGKFVLQDLEDAGEATPQGQARLAAIELTQEQVLGDWLPEPPG
jgi:hypothetical protein